MESFRSSSPALVDLSRYSPMLQIPTFHHSVHTLSQRKHSVLSLAATDDYIFSGSQGGFIHVWEVETFTPKTVLSGHTGSIFSLVVSSDQKLLFSGSGDGTVRVWCTKNMKCLYVVHAGPNVGDILALAYSSDLQKLFLGCTNTSIQWFDVSTRDEICSEKRRAILSSRGSKFFQGQEKPATVDEDGLEHYVIFDEAIAPNSHFGYVYSLLLGKLPNSTDDVLFSGSGDGDVKLWTITPSGIEHLKTLQGPVSNIYSLALRDELLFCGSQGGDIKIWDLETNQMIRSLVGHKDDVLALVAYGQTVFSASADSTIKAWSQNFECTETLIGHDKSIVLSLIVTDNYLVSGASDSLVKLWDIPYGNEPNPPATRSSKKDIMLYALEKWISMRTVSGNIRFGEECRRGAKFLKSILNQLGAHAQIIPCGINRNPLVFGRFGGNLADSTDDSQKRLNILFYGHYDVMPADEPNWRSPPFELTGRDGYLYGRGVTDNKGPILASIFAAHELQKEELLKANISFLIEGEEENGSVGFYETVERCKELFGKPDMILVSNSYWLGDDMPCLTYGLRGVIHATIEIRNNQPDSHSGVDGGAVSEPMVQMIKILSCLVSSDKEVLIPGFNDRVRPISESEEALYDELVEQLCSNSTNTNISTENLKNRLISRWRMPTLTVHRIDVSGPNNSTVIPASAKAIVSMRIVPDQKLEDIIVKFKTFVEKQFSVLNTDSTLSIEINNTADWWLGDAESPYFKAAESAIEQEWGVKPLHIREGGSIPAIRWLEKCFDAIAINFPMGQSSDQAHLNDERIRLQNLQAGKRIIKNFLRNISLQ
ncbi:Zn-dependent exopeptidase [Basidiobolus meristosporus CBS 931.73]|uniref:Zn-dependent exopeptidase n=1 Tax=Basidiobolus meristosporus CBS 931.73 TaxID=1314790 RepID=A0A1Y1YTD1_9FUNG|nr:Zn-dependent exopeptidase [Basidiobolus meristosporus CBS 931.73]|eukprot:ORY01300.1 Zn-dependent exopeptidase [Basidiobolus meristosporus CBS 931.73]